MGKTKREGANANVPFHKHYAAIYGEARWHDSLYPALARPTRHSALINRAIPPEIFREVIEAAGMKLEDLEPISLPGAGDAISGNACLARRLDKSSDESLPLPQPHLLQHPSTQASLMSHWNMDAASVLAAKLLSVKPGEAVLDLCAAPGGKSIALAQDLFFQNREESTADFSLGGERHKSILCSNEADKVRFSRLAENLNVYLPGSLNVKCTNIDATSPNAHRELAIAGGWDKILVDAPCSSERHIVHGHIKAQASGRVAPEMANRRPGSTKRLQDTQVNLVMTALRLVKAHGIVLYATCSIEPGENDGVFEKVRVRVEKEKKNGLISWDVKIDMFSTKENNEALQQFLERNWAERTKHGWITLPDHPSGGRWGPLFFTVLTKGPPEG